MMHRQQQQRRGVRDWLGAYNLGLVMGQHVDIIAVYQRHRYCMFPCLTATCFCSLGLLRVLESP